MAYMKISEHLNQSCDENKRLFSRNFKCIQLCMNIINHVTWHNGAVPDDEVWLKLGGDKGGSKLYFQY